MPELPRLQPADLAEITAIRRQLHQHPEIGMDTAATANLVEAKLREWGADRIERITEHGLAAEIRGNRPGVMIGLRADMDALPVPDCSGAEWRSCECGRNHACGHDGHTAGLLAVARWLTQSRDFPGSVVLIFQPGEEGFSGARKMMDAGLFRTFPVKEVYAWHGAATHPVGTITLYDGAMSASADVFTVNVHGRGGHGARPNISTDAIVAASELVCAFQTIVSRNMDPLRPGVLSVCSIHGGNAGAPTVIPSDVEAIGTVRAMHPADRDMIERRMNEVCEGVARLSGVEIRLDYDRRYPVLINSHEQYEALAPKYRELLGADKVDLVTPGNMGGEDFAFMLEEVPGLYIRIGLADDKHQAPLHNEAFDFNDRALPVAAGLMIFTALDRLQALS